MSDIVGLPPEAGASSDGSAPKAEGTLQGRRFLRIDNNTLKRTTDETMASTAEEVHHYVTHSLKPQERALLMGATIVPRKIVPVGQSRLSFLVQKIINFVLKLFRKPKDIASHAYKVSTPWTALRSYVPSLPQYIAERWASLIDKDVMALAAAGTVTSLDQLPALLKERFLTERKEQLTPEELLEVQKKGLHELKNSPDRLVVMALVNARRNYEASPDRAHKKALEEAEKVYKNHWNGLPTREITLNRLPPPELDVPSMEEAAKAVIDGLYAAGHFNDFPLARAVRINEQAEIRLALPEEHKTYQAPTVFDESSGKRTQKGIATRENPELAAMGQIAKHQGIDTVFVPITAYEDEETRAWAKLEDILIKKFEDQGQKGGKAKEWAEFVIKEMAAMDNMKEKPLSSEEAKKVLIDNCRAHMRYKENLSSSDMLIILAQPKLDIKEDERVKALRPFADKVFRAKVALFMAKQAKDQTAIALAIQQLEAARAAYNKAWGDQEEQEFEFVVVSEKDEAAFIDVLTTTFPL